MSQDAFEDVIARLQAEATKNGWSWRNLTSNEMPNPFLEKGVAINASRLEWRVYFDAIRQCLLTGSGGTYDLAKESAATIASKVAHDISYLNAERHEVAKEPER